MKILSNWRFWLGCAISLVCLWLSLRRLPIGQVADLVAHANLLWLLAAIALQLFAVITRAQRWQVLLIKKGRFGDSFSSQSVGYLFKKFINVRMCETARVIIMGQRCGLPVMQVAASAIVERVLDVATIVLALVLVLPWMKVPVPVIRGGLIFGFLSFGGIIILLLAVRFKYHSEKFLQNVLKRVPILPVEGITDRWRESVIGLTPLTCGRVAVQSVVWSFAAWGGSIGMYWCVLRSFQSDGAPVEAVFMVVALSFAVSVPSSPGFLGVFQLVGQQALVLPFGLKYSATNAMAITMTAYLIYYLVTTFLGIIGLWQLGQSFTNLERMMRSRNPKNKIKSPHVVYADTRTEHQA